MSLMIKIKLLQLLAGLGVIVSASAVYAAEVRVLVDEPGTSSTGQWASASGASMRLEGLPGLYAISGSGATYTFTPTLPLTTEYAVEVFNNCYSPRAHNVTHVIQHAEGTATLVLEQDCAVDPFVGNWRPLGTFRFNAGAQGNLRIHTANANNSYVGATGVRFIYTGEPDGNTNTAPTITPSITNISVVAGASVALTATAQDAEEGNLTASINWVSTQGNGTGGNFTVNAGNQSFTVTATVTDSQGAVASAIIPVTVTPIEPPPPPLPGASQFFGFDCDGNTPLTPLVGFTTNNANALPQTGTRCGMYMADLQNNDDNITLHFHEQQGRLDAVPINFPFEVIARGVGIAPLGQPSQVHTVVNDAFVFAGIQVHHADLENRNSAHVVVGQRGGTRNTIEGKHTRDAGSQQDDIGNQALPTGRADIRIVGNANRTLTVYWQVHNTGVADNWIAYESADSGRAPGQLRGPTPDWGNSVYVGLITYAYGYAGVPFSGVVESLEVIQH